MVDQILVSDKIIAANMSAIVDRALELTSKWAITKGLAKDPNIKEPSEKVILVQKALNEGILKGSDTAYIARLFSIIIGEEIKTVYDEAKHSQFNQGVVVVTIGSSKEYADNTPCIAINEQDLMLPNKVIVQCVPKLFTGKVQNLRPATRDEILALFAQIKDAPAFKKTVIDMY